MLTSQHGSQWTWNSYLLWIVQRINWNSHEFVKFVSIRFFMNCWNMSKSSQLISSPFPIFSSRPRFTRALPCPGCWTAEEACHETKQARVLLLGPAFSDSQRVGCWRDNKWAFIVDKWEATAQNQQSPLTFLYSRWTLMTRVKSLSERAWLNPYHMLDEGEVTLVDSFEWGTFHIRPIKGGFCCWASKSSNFDGVKYQPFMV